MTKHISTYERTINVQKLDERMKENLLQKFMPKRSLYKIGLDE
jgi:hypothetical protein